MSGGRRPARLALEEDLEFLVSCRTPLLEALPRLGLGGISMSAFEKRLQRWGRYDLIAILKATDPWFFQKGTATS